MAEEPDTGPSDAARPAGSWSLSQGRIVYEVHLGDRVNIYRFDAGAAAPLPLTTHAALDGRPKWSPDGRRIAFYSNVSGNDDIWVVNADGSELERITDHPAADYEPDWLPDGRRIVFASDRDGDQNLWLYDLDSGDFLQLTHYEGGRTGGPSPSGDGRSIAFASDRMLSWQIYRLDLDGEITRLTGPLPGNCNPSWNPRTGRIAYMKGGTLLGTDLTSIRADGSDRRDLAGDEGNNHDPQYSNDGQRLVWASDRHGNWELYEAAADGSGERRVTVTEVDERHPDLWVPDGGR